MYTIPTLRGTERADQTYGRHGMFTFPRDPAESDGIFHSPFPIRNSASQASLSTQRDVRSPPSPTARRRRYGRRCERFSGSNVVVALVAVGATGAVAGVAGTLDHWYDSL